MAKKKKQPVKKAAKVVKMKPKAKAAEKTAKPVRSPRSQVLPGMEQVRNVKLDRICEGIADTRADKNRLTGEEKDLMQQAAKEMATKGVHAYRQAGVELALVPGEPKLRVRLITDSANAKASKASSEEDEESGSGQDAGATLEEMTDEPEDTTDVEREFDAENDDDDE